MTLAETCYQLADGDGHHALLLALIATRYGAGPDFTVCPECGDGFEATTYNRRYCTDQCRKNNQARGYPPSRMPT